MADGETGSLAGWGELSVGERSGCVNFAVGLVGVGGTSPDRRLFCTQREGQFRCTNKVAL